MATDKATTKDAPQLFKCDIVCVVAAKFMALFFFCHVSACNVASDVNITRESSILKMHDQ